MDNLKEYLEQQKLFNEELDNLLQDLNKIEQEEKELLYNENQKLREELEKLKQGNVETIEDRLTLLRKRIISLANQKDIKEDKVFLQNLLNMNSQAARLENNIKSLIETLNMKELDYKKKNNLTNKTNQETFPNTLESPIIKEGNSIEKEDVKQSKTEFKIGSNLLNIVGVILVLISLITFGKYVYTNLLTDTLKGFSLFIIAALILVTGEYYFKPKLPKYAEGISALGISALYATLIINYLVLNTLNGLSAILISILITGLAVYISKRNNSHIIRILALIGGYGCLFPFEMLVGIQSYIVVIILSLISVINLVVPIDKKEKYLDFEKYSIILNISFFLCFAYSGNIETYAIFLYLLVTMSNINITYLINKNLNNKKTYKTLFLSTLIILGCSIGQDFSALIFVIYLLLFSIFSYLSKNKQVFNVFLSQIIITLFILTFYIDFNATFIYSLIFFTLTIINVIIAKKQKSSYLQLTTIGLMIASFITTLLTFEHIIFILGLGLLEFIIWYLSDCYKEKKALISLKYTHLSLAMIYLNYLLYLFLPTQTLSFTLSIILIIVFVMMNTYIDYLRNETYKTQNKYLLILFLVINSFYWETTIIGYLLMTIMMFSLIYLLTHKKYVDNTHISKFRYILYAISLIYNSFVLFNIVDLNITLSGLLFSIILMIIAFGCVWFGFKKEDIHLRKLGLCLALFVCIKIIVFDFYTFEFIFKTMLFLIVGIIALIISYIYSKLEKENKDNNK